MRAFIVAILTGPLLAAESPRVEFALGVLEEERGNDDAAKARFEKALSLDPQSLPLVENVVKIRLGDNDRAGAIKLMRDLANSRPDHVDVQLAYAGLLEQTGRGDALARKLAVETLEKVLVEQPGDLSVISSLLNLFRESGEKARAIALMEKLPEDSASAAITYQSLSEAMFSADDPEGRAKVDARFRKALAAHPKDPQLARAASDYFRNSGRMDDAIAVLAGHVGAAPWSLDLRTRLGVLQLSAKLDDEGEATLKEVVAIRPRSELALQSLSKFYRLKGDEKLARKYNADLLKFRGGSAREFLLVADEFLTDGDPRSARLLLEKAVFDYPENPELSMKLAVATRRDPETRSKAARLFREAEAAMDPQKMDADFLIESADVMAEDGNGKAAEEKLRRAIKSYPPDRKKESAAAMRRLAALWEKEGRNAEAARSLRQRADALDR